MLPTQKQPFEVPSSSGETLQPSLNIETEYKENAQGTRKSLLVSHPFTAALASWLGVSLSETGVRGNAATTSALLFTIQATRQSFSTRYGVMRLGGLPTLQPPQQQ